MTYVVWQPYTVHSLYEWHICVYHIYRLTILSSQYSSIYMHLLNSLRWRWRERYFRFYGIYVYTHLYIYMYSYVICTYHQPLSPSKASMAHPRCGRSTTTCRDPRRTSACCRATKPSTPNAWPSRRKAFEIPRSWRVTWPWPIFLLVV